MMTQKALSLTDKHVASRIRLRRLQLGMSQDDLAQALNISFQQVQKDEKGASRVSAGRLRDIAAALSVAPQYFYQEGSGALEAEEGEDVLELAQLMASPEVVSMIQALTSFRDSRILKLMSELTVAITEEIAHGCSSEGATRRSSPGR